MNYELQKKFFKTAYTTGSDTWSTISKDSDIESFLGILPKSALLLDLGSGRGRLAFSIAKMGFRIIGLDYIEDINEKNNKEAKEEGLEGKLKFFSGDALDIPFTRESFDGAIDISLMNHLTDEDHDKYLSEVNRVLKTGGHFLLFVLSKETAKYLNHFPSQEEGNHFEFHDTHYHFFTKSDLEKMLSKYFEIIDYKSLPSLGQEKATFHRFVLKKI
ncbi:MAG: class I SAM-dependent methyltransferase [Candidatus Nomurabacteria bacterium]|nr:MAG: class I SAM-dependent methyltransferase [Candidatus Nomurabacteria bacterium]